MIYALYYALGNPPGFELSSCEAHDLDGADVLLGSLDIGTLLIVRAYDADDRMCKHLAAQECVAVISS